MAAPARALGAKGFQALVGVFTLSGAAGLVDQVCFSKYLSYVVGATAYAVSAVLAAFMTGLAVGATVGGRISSRVTRPLVAYGIAEVLVGFSVALSPLAFAGLTPVYVGLAHHSGGSLAFLSLLRWLVAFLFVAIPTAAMGATLPLVSAALASGDDSDALRTRERRLGILYAANTFGGAAGALIGAYAVLPALGLSKSLFASASVSVLAGLLTILLDKATGYRQEAAGSDTQSPSPATPASPSFSLLAFPSGFIVFILASLSAHVLVSIVGTSSQASGLIAAAFVASLLIAGLIATRLSRQSDGKATRLTLAGSALALGATLPFRSTLPFGLGGLGALVAFAFILVPTAMIGATLPLLSDALTRGNHSSSAEDRTHRLGVHYVVNSFCGALGAFAGAYAALPALGASKFLNTAAAASVFAGLVAVAFGSRADAAPPPRPLSSSYTARWLVFLAFLSGFLVFTMEVVSTHLLVVIVGNSAYAFGLILAAFLTSLFIGAALASSLLRRTNAAALGYSLAFSALAVAATLPLWDDLPFAFGGLGEHVTTFAGREAMRALVAFGILFVPATCMGLTFPLVLRWAAEQDDVGRFVGRLTAVNTLGAVVGALGTGYVVIPLLGSERSLLFVALVFAVAATLSASRSRSALQKGPVTVSLLSVAVALLAPRWNLLQLTSGTNVYFDSYSIRGQLLKVREDVHGGVTTVILRNGVRTLYTNGKFQGNDGWELNAQRYFAHYPCLFVRSFDEALVIGLGTGTTLGTLTAYPWKRIEVAEISPAIVDAARTEFPHTNRRALEDPRVHVTIADGRNYLLVTSERYSIITMELTSVWFAGAASLYSSEYYRMVGEHLAPGGVFQQWVQMHHVSRPVFATLVNTLRREFGHVALFYGGGQGILVASKRPLQWSKSRTDAMSNTPEFVQMRPNGRPLSVLTDDILALDDGLDRFIADSAREAGADLSTFVSNDDNLFLEYQTPRGNVLPWSAREELAALVHTYRDEAAVAALDTDSARIAQ